MPSPGTRCRTRCCDAQAPVPSFASMPSLPPVVVAALIVRSVPYYSHKCHHTGTRRSTRCCDAQGAGAIVYRNNAIFPARRGGRVDREGRAYEQSYSHRCHHHGTRRRTRCCDAQCAGALFIA